MPRLPAVAALVASALAAADADPVPADRTNLLTYRDGGGKAVPVRTADDWAKRRAGILAAMREVMGPLPGDERRVPLDPQTVEEVAAERYVRRKVTIAVEP